MTMHLGYGGGYTLTDQERHTHEELRRLPAQLVCEGVNGNLYCRGAQEFYSTVYWSVEMERLTRDEAVAFAARVAGAHLAERHVSDAVARYEQKVSAISLARTTGRRQQIGDEWTACRTQVGRQYALPDGSIETEFTPRE